ncbi:MAG: Gfo/Idh/MocA family oxidoreductase [Dissulfuribacterales bacterium]
MKPIKVAVVGVGYLGRFHAQKYKAMPNVELVCVVEPNPERGSEIAQELQVPVYNSILPIIGQIDAVSVACPTVSHFHITRELLNASIHCFVEKPITTTLDEANELIALASQKGLILQVGHIERFNPAIAFLLQHVTRPMFIEAHRLSVFKQRAIDVDVVLDLMIHDLDLVLALMKTMPRELHAVGTPVLTPNVDIANARLVFANGCVANLTASRISLAPMRKFRVFEPGRYISADSIEQKNVMVSVQASAQKAEQRLLPTVIEHDKQDSLLNELNSFIEGIRSSSRPPVTGEDGRLALALAMEVKASIEMNRSKAEFGQ